MSELSKRALMCLPAAALGGAMLAGCSHADYVRDLSTVERFNVEYTEGSDCLNQSPYDPYSVKKTGSVVLRSGNTVTVTPGVEGAPVLTFTDEGLDRFLQSADETTQAVLDTYGCEVE